MTDETATTPEAPRKKGGWPKGKPRKAPVIDREPQREAQPNRFNMRAKPNWENFDATSEDSPDRLKINPALIPEGMSAQWVTDSIYGKPESQHRMQFERKGWTPVHQSDFNGQFDGMFMPKGKDGEITVDGLVLMMRPKELTDLAKRRDLAEARERVAIKEQALRGGDLQGVSLDAQHPSAVRTNRISKTLERITVPGDK